MSNRDRSAAVIASAVAVSVALVLVYVGTRRRTLHLHGARPTRAYDGRGVPRGLQATLEQIALSTADGAACDLHVSREELVLALGSESDLDRFAAKRSLSRSDAESAIRDGLVRAIDDGEQADAVDGGTADVLRGIATRLPIGLVLAVLRGASGLLS